MRIGDFGLTAPFRLKGQGPRCGWWRCEPPLAESGKQE